MKRLFFISIIILLSFGVKAQTDETTVQDILNYRPCYEKHKSHGLREKKLDIGGETYNLMSERDYARENIMVSDKKELQKLSDKISYESFGIKGKFGSIVDWKSMNNLFGSRIQAEQASMSYTQEGTFQLMAHGVSDQSHNSMDKIRLDDKEVDAEKASEIILKELEGYDIITNYTDKPLVVVIHSCGVGSKSENSFASKLSGILAKKSPNIYVVAAPENIYPSASTWPTYKETVKDKNGEITNWNCFHGGKFLEEGDKDFDTTVTKLQKKYSKGK